MPLQQGEYLSITPAAQKLALLMLIVVCVAPALFNLLGINFSSYTQPIFPHEQQAVLNTLKNLTSHATLEWSAVIFTLLGAAASFIHYALKRNILVPIIGIGLFASGLLDVFHNVIPKTSVHEL
jgi:cytochrome b561